MKLLFFALISAVAFLGTAHGQDEPAPTFDFETLCGQEPTAPVGTRWACFELSEPDIVPTQENGVLIQKPGDSHHYAVWLKRPRSIFVFKSKTKIVTVEPAALDGCVSVSGDIKGLLRNPNQYRHWWDLISLLVIGTFNANFFKFVHIAQGEPTLDGGTCHHLLLALEAEYIEIE
ncbi:uncharacterized protein UTRI_02668 [Ustilago trichophora]|uniref:Uncharacterized protein n=1 Tax=Ustilago trichophora TaxID=86804 RepID=A0A5C3ERR2_9BASI|nr:uncharacterized protein UTRI_02668 [Ustilago trichophora]